MVKFIIIGNDIKTQKQIKDIIVRVAFNISDFIIEKHSGFNGKLLATIEDLSLRKIYLLNIELNDFASGIRIAKKIRKNDWESHIIFLTNHEKMFEQARSIYEVFDFIEHFYRCELKLEKDLKLILSRNCDNKLFKYQNKKIELQLYLKDITYIYRDTSERKLVIHTTHNNFKIYMNLNKILDLLDSRFRQVHRACIVNVERVNKFNWAKGEFTLDNREVIPLLSRSFKDEVR